MSKVIVHYINQFFAGKGGEDMADYKPEVIDGTAGPVPNSRCFRRCRKDRQDHYLR